MAFVLLAGAVPDGSLLIRDVVAALPSSAWTSPALVLLVLGFGLKIGLVPFHVWMPLTYSEAPIPAAAVLSGAAVNAGVIGFIRFLPFETALAEWGYLLVTAGLVSAFYGVAIGVTQANPRSVLAYSSVSQMGLIAAILGMRLAAGDGNATSAAAFCALHHTLVKGGLFLAIGVVVLGGVRGLWPVLFPAAVLALGLAGLPLTGGPLAKLAMKEQLGSGIVGTLATISAVGSTMLMLHFLRCLAQVTPQGSRAPAASGLALSWLAIAASSIVLPWAPFFDIADEVPYRALTPTAIWETLWPMLVGAPLAVLLWRRRQFLPRIPEGDVLVVAKYTVPAGRALGSAMERVDGHLRQWTVAGLVFLAFTIILGGAMWAGIR